MVKLKGTLNTSKHNVAGPLCPMRLSSHNPIKSANVTTIKDTHPVSADIPAMDKFLMRDGLR